MYEEEEEEAFGGGGGGGRSLSLSFYGHDERGCGIPSCGDHRDN